MKNKRINPDRITGKPGSHPIGTGIGAGAGGAAAAGAGLGATAGPAGAAVGAAGGAIVGGIAGHAAGEALNPTKIRSFLGHTVVDQNDKKIGMVESIWEDHSGQPAFLGVKTGWLGMGKEHIIPAYSAQGNAKKKQIQVPFSADVVKNAPSYDTDSDLDEAVENQIYDYYQGHGVQWDRNRGSPSGAEYRDDQEARLNLKKEELKVGKRQVDAGGIRLRKIVRTQEVNEPVELRHEEVVIERVPAGEKNVQGSQELNQEDIFIPLRREEPVVEKNVYNEEEVRVKKKVTSEQQNVSDTVREEDVEIEEESRRESRR